MESRIEIYRTADRQTQVEVRFDGDTVWLSQKMMSDLFEKDSDTIGVHLRNIFKDGELVKTATTELFSVVQTEGNREVRRKITFYNLDAIISVGYRVNSKRGTQFRQWATHRLKDYLVQGYAINEKRLEQREMELRELKTGIRILSRAIEEKADSQDFNSLQLFAKGLDLLDDFDHKRLDLKGYSRMDTIYPSMNEYLEVINSLKGEFASDVFAKPKDNSFESSIWQIEQSFNGEELYTTLEEKAATLLYLIVKNHSFVDGNKRIGAACFLHFLNRNQLLFDDTGQAVMSNEALAALTLFVATSRPDEKEVVVRLIISILNRAG